MHGRIKTISTEEQKVKQKKARDAKLQIYTTTMARIFQKRSQGEHDDEALALTREVLLANPDIITLWNYRREIFLSKMKLQEEGLEEMFKSELALTEQCLRVNPKSYGSWHHRVWVLDAMPSPDWEKEVDLCNKYLSLDERNFHCWDYRKIVVERACVPALDEYNFTTLKINTNFSNYSAWHFRSKLLPLIFEDPEGKFPVAEDTHKAELELVQNAAFTDPDDQSAWFYQRWLLGLRSPAVTFICAQASSKTALVALSREIRLGEVNRMEVSAGGAPASGTWKPAVGSDISAVWIFHFLEDVPTETSVTITLFSTSKIPLDVIEVDQKAPNTKPLSFSPYFSTALKQALEEQLRCCRELLDLEPDSKWTLLTSVLLMKSLDLNLYSDEMVSALGKLAKVDSLRAGYYADLSSQILLELQLINTPFQNTFRLVNVNLTCLYHTQYLILVKKVDLSGNKLKSTDLKHLYSLVNCSHLNLDNNIITGVQFLPILNHLETLSVQLNPLENIELDRVHLKAFRSLTTTLL